MGITCSCGNKDLKPIKFGGRLFSLQVPEKPNIFRGSGFEPNIWLCKSCKQILFSLKDEDYNEIP